MDVRYINPFIVAIKKVFKTMLATEVTIGKPSIISNDREPSADVSAVIGLSGDVVGAVILGLPMNTAIKTAGQFAGIEMTASHPDFSDALGELANMIAGQAKSQFEGVRASISLPSVIVGQKHVVQQSRQAPKLAIPCESVLGPFCVEVGMVIEKNGKTHQKTAATAVAAN